ncbi:translocation protein SEC63 homolog [Strongylocentrotus purpuratus]|uniref:J domain-containing protein n=1 Tax=Strongylocentrotus purpuratus TaxID=7668 RepID=A0A7M7PEW6_STRPU|nr:translocation protein SEC63 homolog [Strongylocentrotus purpuratus]
MAKFEYDESGGTSLYFLVSFYALVLFPLTYYLWPSKHKKDDPEKARKACHCDPCESKRAQIKAPTTSSTVKNFARWTFLFLAWVIFILVALKASQVERDHIEYDPFEILQVDRGASEAEIKRQYRKLSKLHHPDKEGGDASMFMKIAKAHAALTDEESRRNWEEYGSPDGRQATTFGIALPAWIVDQNNSVWVLAAYGLAFMVILPIAVGTWWYRSIRYTAVEILIDTTQLFMHFLYKTPCMNLKRALMILSGSFEFEKSHNSQVVNRPSDNEELPPLVREFSNDIGLKNKERPFCYPYSVKVRTLIYAHLARADLPPKTLDVDRLYVVKKCPQLIQEMVNTAAQLIFWHKINKGNPSKEPRLETIEHIMKLSPMVVQSTWDKSPLMQLPHFTEETLRLCQSKRKNVKSISQFIKLKDLDKRYILRHLDERQYQDVLNVCASLPLIDADLKLEVVDDDDKATITAGAFVTATVYLRRDTFTLQSDGDISSSNMAIEAGGDTEDLKTEEKDSPSVNKNKPKAWEKQQKKKKGKTGGGGGGNKPKPKKQQEKEKEKEKKSATKPASLTANSTPSKDSTNDDNLDVMAVDQDDENGSGLDSDDEASQKSASDEEVIEDAGEDEEEWDELQSTLTRKEKVLEGISKESHEVHSPYYPEVKHEWWWVYIADRKSHKLVTSPTMVYDLKNKKEVQLQFRAPSKGNYQFSLCVRSDSYLDLDLIKSIKVDVKEAKKVEEHHPQWDISDDEKEDDAEDSAVSDYTTDDEESDDE